MKTITTTTLSSGYSSKIRDKQMLLQFNSYKFGHYMQQVILMETVKKISQEDKSNFKAPSSGMTAMQVYSHPSTIYFAPFQGAATIY